MRFSYQGTVIRLRYYRGILRIRYDYYKKLIALGLIRMASKISSQMVVNVAYRIVAECEFQKEDQWR